MEKIDDILIYERTIYKPYSSKTKIKFNLGFELYQNHDTTKMKTENGTEVRVHMYM